MFEIEHRPGGLADALAIPKKQKLNLDLDRVVPAGR
jgi:hypothetical protein